MKHKVINLFLLFICCIKKKTKKKTTFFHLKNMIQVYRITGIHNSVGMLWWRVWSRPCDSSPLQSLQQFGEGNTHIFCCWNLLHRYSKPPGEEVKWGHDRVQWLQSPTYLLHCHITVVWEDGWVGGWDAWWCSTIQTMVLRLGSQCTLQFLHKLLWFLSALFQQ